MADTLLAARRGREGQDGDGTHPLRRRRPLPGGRAVVGGFLVALAAVGIFAGYTSATADDRTGYLVARDDLRLGERLEAGDLALAPMELPPRVRERSFRRVSELVGAVVTGPVAKGELVQASDVLRRRAGPAGREISFSIEASRAVAGTLQDGEFVDVLATYGTGTDSQTVVVLRGARVVQQSRGGTLDDEDTRVITLAVPQPNDAIAVAHAANAGVITLVRAAGPDAGSAALPNRAPGSGRASAG